MEARAGVVRPDPPRMPAVLEEVNKMPGVREAMEVPGADVGFCQAQVPDVSC